MRDKRLTVEVLGDASRMATFRGLVALLTGEEPPGAREEEIAQARLELEEALDALRRARGNSESVETLDLEGLRRALDAAQRQLDAARVRLMRALSRR